MSYKTRPQWLLFVSYHSNILGSLSILDPFRNSWISFQQYLDIFSTFLAVSFSSIPGAYFSIPGSFPKINSLIFFKKNPFLTLQSFFFPTFLDPNLHILLIVSCSRSEICGICSSFLSYNNRTELRDYRRSAFIISQV